MEELLPLIIGIVWVVYSLYTRGQKKKSGRKPQPQNENRQPSLLEQILSGQGISISEPEETDLDFDYEVEPVIADKEPVKKRPLPFLNSELNEVKGEGQSSITNYFESENFAFSEDDERDWEFVRELEDFDLKKAVIYSEILNAPYIDYK
ncbi:MAG: hypothetical protein R2750_00320 [Bacteroidales bacterium]